MQFSLISQGRSGRDLQIDQAQTAIPQDAPGIVISVDAAMRTVAGPDSSQSLCAVGSALHTLLGEHGLTATWGLHDPLTSPLVSQLLSARRTQLSHEIAFNLNGACSGATLRRPVLADALAQCVRQAVAGVRITTLFADSALVSGNLDLLLKCGISALRNTTDAVSRSDSSARLPRQLRYGLWGFPVAHTLPSNGLVSGIEKMLVGNPLDQKWARQARVFHVSVELARLSSGDRAAWRVVEKSLRRMAKLQMECGVRIESLRSLTARLSSVRVASPQRSILRRAA
jgi:hypothetical protein